MLDTMTIEAIVSDKREGPHICIKQVFGPETTAKATAKFGIDRLSVGRREKGEKD